MYMVHVIVGDQYSVNIIVSETVFHKFLLEPSHAHPGIDNYTGTAFSVIHVQEVAISAAAA